MAALTDLTLAQARDGALVQECAAGLLPVRVDADGAVHVRAPRARRVPADDGALMAAATAGLPLGDTARLADAEMRNLLGDEVAEWREILADPGAKLHLYGKAEARPGRKMGHVTRLIRRG